MRKNVAKQDGHQSDTSLLTKAAFLLQEEGEHEYAHRQHQTKYVAAREPEMKHSASCLLSIAAGYAVRHLVHSKS